VKVKKSTFLRKRDLIEKGRFVRGEKCFSLYKGRGKYGKKKE